MSELMVVKRNGNVVDFDEIRIRNAIARAIRVTDRKISDEDLDEMIKSIVEEIKSRFVDLYPNVENIQDIVEKHLMRNELFEVAKHYILYRSERQKAREQEKEKVIEKTLLGKLTIKKKDGRTILLDPYKLRRTIERAINGYEEDVSAELISNGVVKNMFDGMTTEDIDRALAMTTVSFIERNPAYSKVAARFFLQRLYKEVIGESVDDESFELKYREKFIENIQLLVENRQLDRKLLEFDLNKLAQNLNPERDNFFDYIGVETLYDRYFIKKDKKRMEMPQGFWMRVAMGLAINEESKNEKAIEFYDVLSTLRFVSSTPTLFHSGTAHPQLSSCYLTTVSDDLDHIFKCLGDNAQLSKWAGGLGNDWSYIRGTGALIKSNFIESQGVIPFLKIANDVTVAINRSGRRRGATCAYLETWHYDLEDFIDLRKNTGDERRRTHDMNTANWIPDLFMKRVAENKDWTLFSPDETPELHDLYGNAFEEKYIEYEEKAKKGEIKEYKVVSAVKLWRKMLSMLFETGHPWITFKDPCNIRSPQDHVGVVHSSNLCTEITLNTSPDETAVCNLGSVNLTKHIKDGKIDGELLAKTVKTAVRMLDNVVNINFYPTKEAQNSNLKHRPIGLGIMGFQDALFLQRIPFQSDAALEFADKSMEFISYYALLASSELAKEKGTYESYSGSKWDRGIFPLDTVKLLEEERGIAVDVNRDVRFNWDELRTFVKENGMRNSNVMAIAPTATIANIAGCYPCIEPIYKNIYVKANISGEFTIVNKYLVEDLKNLNLWNQDMLDQLKYYDGNLEAIAGIPEEIKDLYKEAFDIDPEFAIKITAARGKWIDQSQSHNVFMKGVSGKKLQDIYMTAWKCGLKTTYYLRSLGASQIEKATLDMTKYGSTSQRSSVGSAVVSPDAQVSSPSAIPISASSETRDSSGGEPVSIDIKNSKSIVGGKMNRLQDNNDFKLSGSSATEVKKICSLLDPDCEACQ